MQGFPKKIHSYGTTALVISNKEMNDIMNIVQARQDSKILSKGVTKTIKNETKEQIGGFFGMLLGTLGASLLGNMLIGKVTLGAGYGNEEGKGILRAGYGSSINENFDSNPSFYNLWNTEVLSKLTYIQWSLF